MELFHRIPVIALVGTGDCRILNSSSQRDRLEGTDDVVRALLGEEAFVIAGAEVPRWAFVIFISIKTPHTADDNERADPVVPEIANEMKAQVRARVGAGEADVIVNDELRQTDDFLRRFDRDFARGRGVITQRAKLPFHVDDAAVILGKFGFRYLSHKREMFDVDLARPAAPLSSRENLTADYADLNG